MPIYQFQCDCGNIFERKVSFKDMPHSAKCPKCGEKALRKMSAVVHIWKEGQKPA